MDATATVSQLTEQDVDALRRIIREFERLTLDANWDGFASLYTEDVVVLPPEQPIVEGKSAARAWLDTFPPIKRFSLELKHAEGRADLAVTRGTLDMTVEPTPGKRVTMTGKWTSVFRRQPDGAWRCALDIWNTDHPIPGA